MLTEYVSGDSPLHRLDVRTKTIWAIVLMALAFFFDHPVYGAVLVGVTLVLFKVGRVPMAGVRRILLMMLPILVIMVCVTSFSTVPEQFRTPQARTVLFYLFPNDTAPLTVGGLLIGLMFLCRIVVMVLASLLLTCTTPMDDFLQLSRRIRIPYKVAFILTTAVRFIPTMENKARMVLDAQRCRGVNLDMGNFATKIRSYVSVMIPMIVDSIRMSEDLAVALMNRGFGAPVHTTFLSDIRMKGRDYVLVALALLVFVLGGILRFRQVGQL